MAAPELQSEGWYPAPGIAVIARLPPELTQVLDPEAEDVLAFARKASK
jgi:hypothetical protein